MVDVASAPARARGGRAASAPYRTPRERKAAGKALRAQVPLASHAEISRDPSAPDSVTLLREQGESRVQELLPIRYGRMLASPFAHYRGAARVMAQDLSTTARTGLLVQACGDAHLSNFGLFGSPERRLLFDINDFDETLPGPWEWDVKRLAASICMLGRQLGMSRKRRSTAVAAAAARYRAAMAQLAGTRDIEVWYAHADADELQALASTRLDAKRGKKLDRMFARARERDSMHALGKLGETVDGQVRIVSDPPLIAPLRDLLPEAEHRDLQQRFTKLLAQYRRTLQSDRRVLFDRYRFVDIARKVVGVGSVGTRCWILLFSGRDSDDPLFLQVKEAEDSVLAEFLGPSEYANQGQRVVAGQRLMQEASDIMLGWLRTTGLDGVQRDFYIRQLRDWKGSIPVEVLQPEGVRLYGELCAWCLARAHARSGDRIAIAGYLGSSPAFDRAIVEFAEAYADLNESDYRALADAAADGTITATVT